MAGRPHQRPVHSGTGASSGAPEPADGKRRLIRGEGLVARISDDYEPQLPVVGEDIPGPAVPCHVGTSRLLVTVDRRTKTVGCAVRRPSFMGLLTQFPILVCDLAAGTDVIIGTDVLGSVLHHTLDIKTCC